MLEIWKHAFDSLDEGCPATLVMVVDHTGSVRGTTGATMVVSELGSAGTVGGGAVENEMTTRAGLPAWALPSIGATHHEFHIVGSESRHVVRRVMGGTPTPPSPRYGVPEERAFGCSVVTVGSRRHTTRIPQPSQVAAHGRTRTNPLMRVSS